MNNTDNDEWVGDRTYNALPDYLKDDGLPWMQWIKYKGVHCVGMVNIEKSLNARRPIIDIHYCMTQAHNGIVEKSVNFNPEYFKPSHLEFDEKQHSIAMIGESILKANKESNCKG